MYRTAKSTEAYIRSHRYSRQLNLDLAPQLNLRRRADPGTGTVVPARVALTIRIRCPATDARALGQPDPKKVTEISSGL